MVELPLPGGSVNDVVRVGDTVRRPTGDRAHFVHQLLQHLAQHGWTGAPRFLGVDEWGRETLTFLDGYVAWKSARAPEIYSTDSLVQVARLVREFHDLTAGTALAGEHEVVCHNDLAPKNTVYRDAGSGLLPVAFLDWDLAAPGSRIHDVAHVCWQYLDLGPAVTDIAEAARHMRLICDAYGPIARDRVVDTILWWQDRCWRGIEAAATTGDTAMARLRDSGAVDAVRCAYNWVADHRGELDAALA